MYCINCGVKLADSEKICPLCNTALYHPELKQAAAEPLYPVNQYPAQRPHSVIMPVILSTLFLMPLLITLLCDLRINGSVTWSGYVMGALFVGYAILALPGWFRKPNPALMVFCDFAAIDLYLLYINHAVGGSWFWGFAFPLVSVVGIIVTAVVLLMRRFPRHGLLVFGGAFIVLGGYMPFLERFINLTFHKDRYAAWSQYPLVSLVLLGALLIFLGANARARHVLEEKFFI